MNLIFTTEEMIKSLESIGYSVKLESLVDEDKYPGGLVISRETPIYNIYRHNELVVNWGKGKTSRLEFVFREELQKRLLGLFSGSPEFNPLVKF